jgi:hypothetical protein
MTFTMLGVCRFVVRMRPNWRPGHSSAKPAKSQYT